MTDCESTSAGSEARGSGSGSSVFNLYTTTTTTNRTRFLVEARMKQVEMATRRKWREKSIFRRKKL